MHVHCSIRSRRTEACGVQFDGPMQGQAQAAAAAGMVLRYVGSLDLVHRKCSVALKVVLHQDLCCALNGLYIMQGIHLPGWRFPRSECTVHMSHEGGHQRA